MIKTIKLAMGIILFCGYYAQGQGFSLNDSLCTDFEDSAAFISIPDTNSIWQRGVPHKTVFNDSYSPERSIVTDTVNSYPANDSSVFYAVYGNGDIWNYLGIYAPLQINFWHRFNMDSLTDFGSIEMSIDGGSTWIDMLKSEFNFDSGELLPNKYPTTHIFESTGDTIYDSLAITGNSNGWVHSSITKDLFGLTFNNVDSIIIKFTFHSDSIQEFKDGWQIDDLCIVYLIDHLTGVEIRQNDFSEFRIYPNPVYDKFIIKNDKFSIGKVYEFKLYSLLGKEIKHELLTKKIQTMGISVPKGIYLYSITNEASLVAKGKLIVQ